MVYAYRADALNHSRFHEWLEKIINNEQAFALSEQVLSGFLRVVTHPRIFNPPSPLEDALQFVTQLRERPNAILIAPGERHWSLFVKLCRQTGAKGNLIADAYLAALAIETGSEWITTDQDYSRFEGLTWRHPFKN